MAKRRNANETKNADSTAANISSWSRDDCLIPSDKPPEISCDMDAASVESSTPEAGNGTQSSPSAGWGRPHVGQPVLDSATVLGIGFLLLVLAVVWPPLLLVVAYGASKLICYSFRDNDDATIRRQLYAQFCQESDELPDRFRNIHKYVGLEESFWTNERYVRVVRVAGLLFCIGRASNTLSSQWNGFEYHNYETP
jgi:hypothetical protein